MRRNSRACADIGAGIKAYRVLPWSIDPHEERPAPKPADASTAPARTELQIKPRIPELDERRQTHEGECSCSAIFPDRSFPVPTEGNPRREAPGGGRLMHQDRLRRHQTRRGRRQPSSEPFSSQAAIDAIPIRHRWFRSRGARGRPTGTKECSSPHPLPPGPAPR